MSENHAVSGSDRGIDKQLIVRLPDMDCSVSYNITAFPSWQFFVNFPGQKELENDLTPVAAMWNLLGVQLGINPDTLRGIGSTSHLCAVRFQKTMNEWLRNVDGPKTWKQIIEALESCPVGRMDVAGTL